MTEVGRSGASAPSGSQAAPGAAEVASPPSVSIPIAESVRLRRIAWLIGTIYVHGDFRAETANERELERLLREQGTFWDSLIDYYRDFDAQGIEARRAETRSGSVHESPVAAGDAPKGDEL